MALEIDHIDSATGVRELGLEGFEKAGGIWRLRNNDVEMLLSAYGLATIRVTVPDRNGRLKNIVLGYRSLEEYQRDTSCQGRIVVPHANRIGPASYRDDKTGETVNLFANNGNFNNLHSGVCPGSIWIQGINNEWHIKHQTRTGLEFGLEFVDGHGGFPGPIHCNALVGLSDNGTASKRITQWSESYVGVPLDATDHTYFNPHGVDLGRTVHDLLFRTNATMYVEVDGHKIPLPENALVSVDGTRYDFREERHIGNQPYFGKDGYDVRLVAPDGHPIEATLVSRFSGIGIECTSDRRTAQFYTASAMSHKSTEPAGRFSAVCIEPGKITNGPNNPNLCALLGVNPVLYRKGDAPDVVTINYRFFVDK